MGGRADVLGDVMGGIKRQRKYNNLRRVKHSGISNKYLSFIAKQTILEFYLRDYERSGD